MSSWKLSTQLIAKHFGKLGESIAEAIASFDPETATQVDRDALQAKLRQIALKLSEARRSYKREQQEADDLLALITQDEAAIEIIIKKLEAGEINDQTADAFAENLEQMKSRLPGEQQDALEAKELVDTLEDILKTIERNIAEFDAHAKRSLAAIQQAKADKERQDLRLENQRQISALHSGLGKSSTALGALNRKAERLRVEADATAIIADVGQKPIDQRNAVDEARRLAAGTVKPVSTIERLRAAAHKDAA